VIFEYPPEDFRELVFDKIQALKLQLKTAKSALRASFKVSSNTKYISAKCKVPSCESLITFRIERVEGEGERRMIIRCNKFKNHHVHPPGFHTETKLPAMVETLEKMSMTMTSPNAF
jgi:hypothetical protein